MVDFPEEWRALEDWPDYEVSGLGRVRRRTDAYFYSTGAKPRIRVRAGYVLKPRPTGRGGYPTVLFPVGDPKLRRFRNVQVHVLVCSTFHGPPPSPNHEVAHWDGDGQNPRADNLRWATKPENAQDKIRHGRTVRGAAHRSVKLTEDEVREIRALLGSGAPIVSLARRFGVTYQAVQEIRSGRTWAWLT